MSRCSLRPAAAAMALLAFWFASRAETGSARLLWAERAWNWINNFWSLRTSYGPLCTRIWGEYASARLLDILMCGSPLGHVDAATGRHSHRSDCSSAAALHQGASGDGRWHRWRMLVLWCTVVLITKLGGAKSQIHSWSLGTNCIFMLQI